MQEKYYCVYLMMNQRNTVIYTGITSNLSKRVWQHKQKIVKGFTYKYNVDKLVHYEIFLDPIEAIKREKEIKGWLRKKKLILIRKSNPTFRDVNDEL